MLEEKMLRSAVKSLEALDAQFKIITKDGREFGELAVVPPITRRYNYYKDTLPPKLVDMAVKEKRLIAPEPGDDLALLQTAVGNYASGAFGSGNYRTALNRELNCVEVMRIG